MVSLRRKILFYTFILAFFALSFFVILYAQGYRVKWSFPPKINMLEKTGMLIIKTEPSSATVFLNDKPVESEVENFFDTNKEGFNETPSKIKALSPKEYKVTLKKDGYHDWKQKINIYPGRITTLSDVHLFRNSIPLKVSKYKFLKENISPNNRFAINPKNEIFLNIANEDTEKLDLKNEEGTNKNIIWSKEGDNFLINNTLINSEELTNRTNLNLPENSENIQLSDDEDILYFIHNNSLKYLDLDSKKITRLVNKSYKNYLVREEYIFGMNGENTLEIRPLDDPESVRRTTLPCSSTCRIVDFENDLINIYDSRYETLYLIRFTPPVLTIKETINNVKYFEWVNEDNLVYADNFEIWNYNAKKNKKNLYTRISEKIEGILPHPESRNIIFYTKGKINILSPRKFGRANITELTNLNQVSDLTLGNENSNIYFNASIGNQNGFYKLKIK